MSHALITGIRGFTGKYVAETLSRAGYSVTGTYFSTNDVSSDDQRSLNICDFDDCRSCIEELRPSHIVHLAAKSFVGDTDNIGFYNVNVLGTLNLLRACIEVGHVPDGILIASSANIYGNASGYVDELTVPAPVNHYGASKLAMEHMVRTWSDRLPIVITRPFNYTGRDQESRFLVPKIVSHFAARKEFIELGNLDVVRDFSDVRYVAEVYKDLLENPQAYGETVNVCSSQPNSLEDVLALTRRISGHDLKVKINPAFVRDNEIKLLLGDSLKLRSLAPHANAINLESTIKWMMQA